MFIILIHSTDSMAHVFVEGNITSQIEYQWFFGGWVQKFLFILGADIWRMC